MYAAISLHHYKFIFLISDHYTVKLYVSGSQSFCFMYAYRPVRWTQVPCKSQKWQQILEFSMLLYAYDYGGELNYIVMILFNVTEIIYLVFG